MTLLPAGAAQALKYRSRALLSRAPSAQALFFSASPELAEKEGLIQTALRLFHPNTVASQSVRPSHPDKHIIAIR